MNKKDYLLLGLDMLKDVNIITAAYNDSKGITRKFNKNILFFQKFFRGSLFY